MIAQTQQARDLLAALPPGKAAVFLDFDGVLVDLAERPDAVRLAPALPPLIARLETATGGALAIVTGRQLADLRGFLPDAPGNVIASHGAERSLGGIAHQTHPAVGSAAVRQVQDRVTALGQLSPDIFVELKPTGAVAHYRQAPASGPALRAACMAIADAAQGFECHAAKCAYELRPDDIGKDKAVADAMEHAPFCGRTPVYFGDDATDEPALAWVRDAGGIAVKVGEGRSVAPHRAADPAQVQAILTGWLDTAGGRT